MKFILSALPTAMMTVAVMSVPVMTYASTDADSIEVSDDVTPVAVTQIIDANSLTENDKPAVAPFLTVPNPNKAKSQALSTLVDPITHKTVDNSYALDVSSFLSLEQAQKLLVQVSPKIAANQAAIAASEYQTDALRTIDNPLVFARVSASAYHLDEDIDLSSLRSGIVNEVNNGVDNIVPPTADLPDFGELVGERIPDSYNFKRSGSTSGAGLGVVWPIYTAGRTDALTGASDARTQEAMADSVLDKNELYNTLIERYFKAQLAIIAAYLREDAYDTLQQTDHMAERLFEEGFISRVDRLEAQSALADAKSESVNANNDARLAMIALQRLLRTDYRIKPTTPLFVSSRPLPDVSYFQDLALNNHPGLQKVAAKRAQAQQLHALSDTGYKPTVLLYGYGQVEKDPSWVAGISASWKLWGGLDKAASLASSSAKIRQADLSEIEVSDNLLLLVEKNWHDVNNAQSRYQALQSNVDLAAEVLRLRRLGLQEGVNTTVDVVQAQTQSLKARTEQAQAANDYVQSLAALMQSCGTPLAFNAYLNAADIQLPTLYTEQ
ncbi:MULTISPECIES: TolC family protein [unclassified Psychrobacter]|uniref:TolC family protein n=1 Tax=unclassified Psychrobacter TaxID=196806 RepID=UPI000CAFA0AC|nr:MULTISPECIES: TolC family protein [unclassified Psychrobacter]MCG3859719.1 TolC family protein [Psychrobacter sp. Ps2]PKH65989.1 TolC family protein [Psychrobacter sp. 4Dc]